MFYHWIYPLYIEWSVLNIFRYITVRSVFAAFTAFIIALLIGKFVIRRLKQAKVSQAIREDGPKKHLEKKGTPTMGAFIMLIPLLISIALWARFESEYVFIVLFAIVWFAFVGFWDDYLKLKVGSKGLPAKAKLVFQFLGAAIVTGLYWWFNRDFQYVFHVNVPFLKNPFLLPAAVYFIFAVLIIVGWSNAVNLTDGLDGLAAGLTLFVFVTFVILAYIIGNAKMSQYLLMMNVGKSAELTVVCAAMVGAILGFLWFNAYPAQVFMGDMGSLMLGGVIGTTAILIKQEILLLIVGIVFVVEVFSVILQVTSYKMTKKRIFRMAPLHHHFQLKGISEPKIIIRFWIVAIMVLLLTLATLKLR